MATYKRFEDLPVWQEAIILAERAEEFIEAAKDRITWSKRDQLDRASLSVSNNIADGARERGDGLRRRRWPEATRRAARAGRPFGRAKPQRF
jgi:four helix bundle protein